MKYITFLATDHIDLYLETAYIPAGFWKARRILVKHASMGTTVCIYFQYMETQSFLLRPEKKQAVSL